MAVMVVIWTVAALLAALAIAKYAPGVAQSVLRGWQALFAVFGILVALYLLSSGATIAILLGMILLAIGVWKLMFGDFLPGIGV